MANLQQVSISDSSAEENISLERQAEMQEAAANANNQQAAPQLEEETRPEWLDDKFQSPEDLAKAYNELQKKVSKSSEPNNAKKSSKEAEVSSNLGNIIEEATAEFSEQGNLSDKSFDSLEKAGLPRQFVEAYIQGQTALVELQTAEVKNTVGGEANYEAMAEWAVENISEEELATYNDLVESGSIDQARMAVRGLFAQFKAAGGKAPQLVQGATSGSSVKPFNSAAQVTEAMRDPRYKNDPAYRQTVEQRLAVTTAF